MRLFEPVSAASLGAFRLLFGSVLVWNLLYYLLTGRVRYYWSDIQVHFPYPAFHWLPILPDPWMHALYWLGVALAALLALGVAARPAAALLTLALGYLFVLEQANYLNHEYLAILLCALLAVVPTSARLSLPAWWAARGGRAAGRRAEPQPRAAASGAESTLPLWGLALLRFQLALPYLFGGISKLNPDWLRGEPMASWLPDERLPLAEWWIDHPASALAFSYGGLLLDLAAVPLLLWARTRAWTFAALVAFHLLNAAMFNIGIFPWLMIGATLLFFPATWPDDLWAALRRPGAAGRRLRRLGGALALTLMALAPLALDEARPGPLLVPLAVTALAGLALGWALLGEPRAQPDAADPPAAAKTAAKTAAAANPGAAAGRRRRRTLALLGVWLALQTLLPLRHFLYPGRASWTEEGHRFAWRMMLRSKNGDAEFTVVHPPTGNVTTFRPADVMPEWKADRVATNPVMLQQLAKDSARRFADLGFDGVEVRVRTSTTLNGRPPQLLLDPDEDLAAAPLPGLRTSPYLEPLATPLPPLAGRAPSGDPE